MNAMTDLPEPEIRVLATDAVLPFVITALRHVARQKALAGDFHGALATLQQRMHAGIDRAAIVARENLAQFATGCATLPTCDDAVTTRSVRDMYIATWHREVGFRIASALRGER